MMNYNACLCICIAQRNGQQKEFTMVRLRHGLVVVVVIALVLNLAPQPLLAQQDILLTLSVPPYLKANIAEVVADFEAANAGIKVHLNEQDASGSWYVPAYMNDDEDLDKFYDGETALAGGGDVIFVGWGARITPDSTTLGLFLDLTPLASGDSELNSDDYYPAAWEHFQWDNGIWALPLTANVSLMTYDPVKFDDKGLAYPSPSWTLDDVINAARLLTVRDGDKVVTKGFDGLWEWQALLASLMQGDTLADTTVVPAAPAIEQNARFAALYEQWRAFEAEKLMGPDVPEGGGTVTYNAPFAISQQWRLTNNMGNRRDATHTAAALLPGGEAGADFAGVALSRATPYPDEAYRLARYLSLNVDKVHGNFGNTLFARRSHNASPASLLTNETLSPALKAVLTEALENALPRAQLRYFDYVNGASFDPGAEADATPRPAREVLRAAQEKAAQMLLTLQEKRDSLQVVIFRPDTAELPAGEVALKFAFVGPLNRLPNQDQWDAMLAEFATTDPEVGRVQFEANSFGLADLTKTYDCFAINWNPLMFNGTNNVLPLDPLMDADAMLDRDDFIGGVLSVGQRANQTFGYPLTIAPEVLRVDVAAFEKAGVSVPAGEWSLNDFLDALRQLRSASEKPESPVFMPNSTFGSGSHLYMFLAAAGAVPINFDQDPVTVDFTSPTMVEAIRQVLDLAKEKLIAYEGLFPFATTGFNNEAAIYADHLMLATTDFRNNNQIGEKEFGIVPFPSGVKRPVSFMVTAAYISAESQHPEACYRLISAMANQPSLLNAMPARRSLLQDPALSAVGGADAMAVFQRFADELAKPDSYVVSGGFSGDRPISSFAVESILFRAFDRYVLEGADLVAELTLAEQYANEYLACTADLPAPDFSSTEWYVPYQACAKQVDPSLVQQ
jgi:ABC-type glycerol-3-phosphate transport system substrate-binding protein